VGRLTNAREVHAVVDKLVHSEEPAPWGLDLVHATGPLMPMHARVPESRLDAPASAEELRRALDDAGGEVASVARKYGRDRKQVYRWMESFGIRKPE